jgi:hypothetical protein
MSVLEDAADAVENTAKHLVKMLDMDCPEPAEIDAQVKEIVDSARVYRTVYEEDEQNGR